MEIEIWKDIPEFEGYYQVSNKGRVKSLARRVKGPKKNGRLLKERILSLGCDNYGYCLVNLQKEGKKKTVTVHKLVARAFIPNPENKKEVDHINTIRIDNRVENLRWATRKENAHNPLSMKKYSEAKAFVKQQKKRDVVIGLCGKVREKAIDLQSYLVRLSEAASNLYGEELIADLCGGNEIEFRRKDKSGFTDDYDCLRLDDVLQVDIQHRV